MNKPLVSVIVLTYNQQDYIARNLDAILSQEVGFDYEIVLGEDASQDRTADICREYQARYPDRIVLQLNEQNKGLVRNYADCVRMSRGKYIADCGGDDYWLDPCKMQREVDMLERHPSLSLVYANYRNYHQQTGIFDRPHAEFGEDILDLEDYGPQTAARFLDGCWNPPIVLSAACYRKSMLEEVWQQHPDLFEGEGCVAEDIPVTAILLSRGPACYLAHDHLVYRVLDESLSHSGNQTRYYRFAVDCFFQRMQVAEYLGIKHESLKHALQCWHADYLHYAFLHRDGLMAQRLAEAIARVGYEPSCKEKLKYAFLKRFGK
ncbi:MAG: glycosyltransferase [Bacteroidales bacterium]|nr:glycosyltransferase [Bacteroidales bacterium]